MTKYGASMTDDERVAELWPHVDGWPDPPKLATATRDDIRVYAELRLAAQCVMDAEAAVLPASLRLLPAQAWEQGCAMVAKMQAKD